MKTKNTGPIYLNLTLFLFLSVSIHISKECDVKMWIVVAIFSVCSAICFTVDFCLIPNP